MADNQRIEDLRRRVQKDPASIAFAQLAEECRRAGHYQEAVAVCDAGLALHPGYLSARVTLGRALIELNELDTALAELTTVLKSAPENLAAIRGVAEIYHRRNDRPAALAQYRAALALARNDPDLQRTVEELARQVEPPPPPPHADGLSFEQMQTEFLKLAPPPAEDVKAEPALAEDDGNGQAALADHADAQPALADHADGQPALAEDADAQPALVEDAIAEPPAAEQAEAATSSAAAPIDAVTESLEESSAEADTVSAPFGESPSDFDAAVASFAEWPADVDAAVAPFAESPADVDAAVASFAESPLEGAASASVADADSHIPSASSSGEADGTADAELRTIAALERWLDAIHVARAERGA